MKYLCCGLCGRTEAVHDACVFVHCAACVKRGLEHDAREQLRKVTEERDNALDMHDTAQRDNAALAKALESAQGELGAALARNTNASWIALDAAIAQRDEAIGQRDRARWMLRLYA